MFRVLLQARQAFVRHDCRSSGDIGDIGDGRNGVLKSVDFHSLWGYCTAVLSLVDPGVSSEVVVRVTIHYPVPLG